MCKLSLNLDLRSPRSLRGRIAVCYGEYVSCRRISELMRCFIQSNLSPRSSRHCNASRGRERPSPHSNRPALEAPLIVEGLFARDLPGSVLFDTPKTL